MDDRQSVLGFTEAELGFFLAALCLVLWLVSTAAAPPTPEDPEPVVPADSAERLAQELEVVRLERDSIADAYQALRDSVSGILPSCAKIGRAEGPLWTVGVVERDRVTVGGETLSFQEFGMRTWPERKLVVGTCWHQVVVRFPRTAPASTTEHARVQLARLRLRIARVEWADR